MIPIVAGLLMGAAMGGGIAALQKKDILQGALMGGVGGALGGAFMPGVAGVAPGITDGVTGAISSGGVGGVAGTGAVGAAGSGGIGAFLGANKYALAGGALGGMMAPGQEPNPADQGNIYTTSFNQERNPEFGVTPGAAYFNPQQYAEGSFSKASDYNPTMTAANGGIIALAEGGQTLEPYQAIETNRYTTPVRSIHPAITDYNAQLLQRADQQYNKNLRPLPIQVPGSPGYVNPTFNSLVSPSSGDDLAFDPVTRRYKGIDSLAKKEKNEMDKMREEMDTMRGEQIYSSADASNSGGGEKNGGRITQRYNVGGLSSLGGYSDGGQLLKGPGDGVSDDIPAQIGRRQPARLADGEFVVPARTVSELGNGSTDAGAKQLYKMLDRVQNARKKSIGKGKVAVDSKASRMLPA